MTVVFYALALVSFGRAVLGLAALRDAERWSEVNPEVLAWLLTAFLGWLVLEIGLALLFVVAARDPRRETGAVWGSLVVIVGRSGVDVFGVLTFPPTLAMWLLSDLVLQLAMFSLWLRAIPQIVGGGTSSVGGGSAPGSRP